jgi:ubiquinone/menaquinone biosynthesis C-methylase UbiE
MNKNILNLGCGKGQNIPALQKRGTLYCVDISSKSLEIAKNKYPQHNYILAKAEDFIMEDNFFDEIYCFDVLEHVDDLDKVLDNIYKMLKTDGILYVEVPFDRSERMLLKVNPNYFNEIGHQRIFEFNNIKEYFESRFKIKKITKSRGIANLYLYLLFKFKIKIEDQMGSISKKDFLFERFLTATTIWFDKNIFNTFLKYIPIWIITLPVGAIISKIYPKTIIIELTK